MTNATQRRDLISSHYANDDARHYAFVRRTGYRASDFRQEWRPRLRDVAYALVTALVLLGLAVTTMPESDEVISHAIYRSR